MLAVMEREVKLIQGLFSVRRNKHEYIISHGMIMCFS